jgi:hypothetical protein
VRFTYKSQPGLHAVPDHGTLLVSGEPPQRLLPTVQDVYVSGSEAYSTAEIFIPVIPEDGSVGYSFEGRFDEVPGFPRQGKLLLVEMKAEVDTPSVSAEAGSNATLQGPEELT